MYFLTGNQGKFTEMKLLLPTLEQIEADLPEIQSLDPIEIIKHKLQVAQNILPHQKLIVEDTSLVLEAWNGIPGPFIKRFLQTVGDKGIWEMIKNFSEKKAFGRSMIGYFDGKDMHFFEGIIHGQIVEPMVLSRFGRDALFQPDGYDKTFAHMTIEEKNTISHRSLALQKFMQYIHNTQ